MHIKVASMIPDAAKKRKRVDICMKHEPQSKKAFVDTGSIDINALIDGSGESILEIHETNAINESIKSYGYDEYQLITGPQLNSAGQIIITIENQDQFLHLHNSYLLIEGNVSKADDTRYADADLVALANNRLLHLFSSLKLTLAGQEVEHVNYPGQATSLLGLASYSSTYSKGCGLAQGWHRDTGIVQRGYLIEHPDSKGSFQRAIPMQHIRFYGRLFKGDLWNARYIAVDS